MTPPAGASVRRPPPTDIVAVVLGAPRVGRGRRLASAVAVTVALHGGLGLWTRFGARETASAPRLLADAVDVDLVPPAPPPPPPDEPRLEPTPGPPPVKVPPAPTPKRAVAASAPAPAGPAHAAAGAVIATDAAGPVDLTGDTVVTGTAARFAGGITTSAGATTVGRPAAAGPGAGPGTAAFASPDHSSPVSLEGRSWSCPWPPEADAEQIERQTVVVRVVVNPDGTVQSAELVTDPGHGFGPAATACALGTRFTPARDSTGYAIRARSPPIRITFVR